MRIKIKELDDSIEKLKAAQSQRDSEITSIQRDPSEEPGGARTGRGLARTPESGTGAKGYRIGPQQILLGLKRGRSPGQTGRDIGPDRVGQGQTIRAGPLKADLEAKMAEMEKVAASLEEKNIELNRTLTEKEKEESPVLICRSMRRNVP